MRAQFELWDCEEMNLTHISKKIFIRVSKLLSVISSQNSWSSSLEILSWTDNEPAAAEPPFLRTRTSYSSVANSLESFIPAKQSKAKQSNTHIYSVKFCSKQARFQRKKKSRYITTSLIQSSMQSSNSSKLDWTYAFREL